MRITPPHFSAAALTAAYMMRVSAETAVSARTTLSEQHMMHHSAFTIMLNKRDFARSRGGI